MYSLEEIASNKSLTKEESLAWFNDMSKKQRPTCECLREIEAGEPRSIYCFVPCEAQYEILEAREKLKNK